MKLLSPVLFFLGYFLGGWLVIWILVMILKQGDPKFAESVDFYYALWIFSYLPIAIMGAIALGRMAGGLRKRLIAAIACLAVVLAAMFFTFHFDVHWAVLLLEYSGFGVGFWLLAKRSTHANTGHGTVEQSATRSVSK